VHSAVQHLLLPPLLSSSSRTTHQPRGKFPISNITLFFPFLYTSFHHSVRDIIPLPLDLCDEVIFSAKSTHSDTFLSSCQLDYLTSLSRYDFLPLWQARPLLTMSLYNLSLSWVVKREGIASRVLSLIFSGSNDDWTYTLEILRFRCNPIDLVTMFSCSCNIPLWCSQRSHTVSQSFQIKVGSCVHISGTVGS
jgi:hypothetical protein